MSVFLSYAKKDEPRAVAVRSALDAAGIDYWSPEKDIRPGDSFVSRIEEGMEAADRILVFLSRETSRSEWVNREIALALAQAYRTEAKRIIPVLLDKNAEIPFFLKDKQYIDLTNPATRQEQLQHLIQAIQDPNATGDLQQEQSSRGRMLELERKILTEQRSRQGKKRVARQLRLTSAMVNTLFTNLLALAIIFAVYTFVRKFNFIPTIIAIMAYVAATVAAKATASVLLPAIENRLFRKARLHSTNEG